MQVSCRAVGLISRQFYDAGRLRAVDPNVSSDRLKKGWGGRNAILAAYASPGSKNGRGIAASLRPYRLHRPPDVHVAVPSNRTVNARLYNCWPEAERLAYAAIRAE